MYIFKEMWGKNLSLHSAVSVPLILSTVEYDYNNVA
jgi:hypothetical protein